ncbi:hypothetical protein Taro_028975 [Colocasia esculenta]|uniref:Uncharacterized protein n=1 Tax=Colocasia esculenta TaxID=4460 RepID=A0A843VMN9_COLES|nr:hypothetical protein [Colocasia esculenta]
MHPDAAAAAVPPTTPPPPPPCHYLIFSPFHTHLLSLQKVLALAASSFIAIALELAISSYKQGKIIR